MSGYSVETKNRFQLILDDEDDDSIDIFEIIKRGEDQLQDASSKSKSKSKSEKKKNVADHPQDHSRVQSDVNKNSKNTKIKNDKFGNSKKSQSQNKHDNGNQFQAGQKMSQHQIESQSGKRDNRFRENRPNDQQRYDVFEKESSGGFGHRGARRGSAGFRGGRGGSRGGFSRRLDRHSGSERTGVKAVEKKEGFGSHNWGGQIDAQLNNSTQPDNKADVNELSEGAVKDGDQEITNEQEPLEYAEAEKLEMTLDEWKASQATSRVKKEFNVRLAGEGEDPKQWKKTVALEPRKRLESSEYAEELDDDSYKVEGTRSALDKLNIQIKFNTDNNMHGSSSGRGRGRGRGFGNSRPPRSGGFDRKFRKGSGGGGFQKSERSAPKMDNEFEFPSLGSK